MLLVPFLAPLKGILGVADKGGDSHPCSYPSLPALFLLLLSLLHKMSLEEMIPTPETRHPWGHEEFF